MSIVIVSTTSFQRTTNLSGVGRLRTHPAQPIAYTPVAYGRPQTFNSFAPQVTGIPDKREDIGVRGVAQKAAQNETRAVNTHAKSENATDRASKPLKAQKKVKQKDEVISTSKEASVKNVVQADGVTQKAATRAVNTQAESDRARAGKPLKAQEKAKQKDEVISTLKDASVKSVVHADGVTQKAATRVVNTQAESDRARAGKPLKVAQEKTEQKDEPNVLETAIIREIMLELFKEAKDHPTPALEDSADPEEISTNLQKSVDFCCQSCTCSIHSPFQRKKPVDFEKKEYMTPTLRNGKARGKNMFSHLAFPLVLDTVRVVWISSEFALAIFGLIFSIATYATGSVEAFNTFHLVLSIVAAILAITDGIYGMKVSCSECVKNCKNGSAKNKTEDILLEAADETGKCCCKSCKTLFDFVRVVLTEVILVPLLICDIFEVVTGAPEVAGNASNIIGMILFAIGGLTVLVYVYFARLGILIGIVKYVQNGRSPRTDDAAVLKSVDYDPSLKKYGLFFQLAFLLHVTGQMMGQVLMLIAIGGKIRYDNRHLYNPSDRDTRVYASPELWYMCVAATVLPVCGLLSFFIVTNFWVQEFPISLCLDMIKLLKMPGADEIFDSKQVVKDGAKEMSKVISKFIRVDQLKTDYNVLSNTRFLDKLSYPFKSPGLIILCLLYAGGQLGFIICAATAKDETGMLMGQVLNGGGWVVYYIFAVVVGALANLYVFAVAAVWVTIISVIICIVMFFIALFCLAIFCGGSSNNNSAKY
ncbi:uncharacterized protein LOC135345659 [Halichondria panicea]|uniref:uncharacterized protein LOC135345659 n=1 Tax=Halichondria panicea TaxID=6063 RepID=UPI00312BA499